MSQDKPTLLIAASGTGGHLFPALAIAAQLEAQYNIVWLGVPDRLETSLVPDRYPLITIPVTGFQGGLSYKTVAIAWGLLKSVFTVRKRLIRHQVQAVFSTGGYIAGPAILAARLQGIPAILHEANFIPGKVTRFFGRFCQQVALGFAGTAKYLPGITTIYTNTPVREAFEGASPSLELPIPDDRKLIVVVGGSQGAIAINQVVRKLAPKWIDAGAAVVHITGDKDPDRQALTQENYWALPFSHEMAPLLKRADLAISRAGAGTLTELAITRTPAILIPYPYAAENHQFHNGKAFADAGAAILLEQNSHLELDLEEAVFHLLADPPSLRAMNHAIKTMAPQNTVAIVAKLIRQAIEHP